MGKLINNLLKPPAGFSSKRSCVKLPLKALKNWRYSYWIQSHNFEPSAKWCRPIEAGNKVSNT